MAGREGDWLKQAEDDFLWAGESLAQGHWAQICFMAQQVSEKALKAIAIKRGASEIRSHSLVAIAAELGINGELERMSRRLDHYYISARYPDAFAEGAPFEYFDGEQAREAIEFARAFLVRARAELRGSSDVT